MNIGLNEEMELLFERATYGMQESSSKTRAHNALCWNNMFTVDDLKEVVENGFKTFPSSSKYFAGRKLHCLNRKGICGQIVLKMYDIVTDPNYKMYTVAKKEELVPVKRRIVTRHRNRG